VGLVSGTLAQPENKTIAVSKTPRIKKQL